MTRATTLMGLVVVGLLAALVVGGIHARPPAYHASGGAQVPSTARIDAAPVARVVQMSAADRVQPDPGWVARTASATGVPAAAVRAYARGALQMAVEQPGCHLGWTTLAGIGHVESGHGSFGGRTLDAGGRSSATVVGPALDGRRYAAVPDGSGWAHARGPMQFIPSTWRRWGADGDGDGRVDVDDLDDAALAAARYLCADSHDLATAAGWRSAVLSYNHSSAYALAVHDAAVGYDTGR